ncbi:hypothetical protein AALC25_11310 [Lachnospiraceae bacterium 29-84]
MAGAMNAALAGCGSILANQAYAPEGLFGRPKNQRLQEFLSKVL